MLKTYIFKSRFSKNTLTISQQYDSMTSSPSVAIYKNKKIQAYYDGAIHNSYLILAANILFASAKGWKLNKIVPTYQKPKQSKTEGNQN